jgi:hypothetical protein
MSRILSVSGITGSNARSGSRHSVSCDWNITSSTIDTAADRVDGADGARAMAARRSVARMTTWIRPGS